MDAVTGAVVIVGLTQGAKPSAELVAGFINRIFGPPADAIGDTLAHPIREWQRQRVERAKQVVIDAAAMVDKAGKEPHHVPARLLMPILEKASVEDVPELQRRWVSLLANAAMDEPAVLPAFAEILGALTPLDAEVLHIAAVSVSGSTPKHVLVQNVGNHYLSTNPHSDLLEAQYQVRMENLNRMGLIYPVMMPDQRGYEGETGVIIPTSGKAQYKNVGITALGMAFLLACTPPDQTSLYRRR